MDHLTVYHLTLEALRAASSAHLEALRVCRKALYVEIETTIGFTGTEPHGTLLCSNGVLGFSVARVLGEGLRWSWGRIPEGNAEVLKPEAYNRAVELMNIISTLEES